MKRLIVIVPMISAAFSVCAGLAPLARAGARQTILVTTFEPFDGRATNASEVVGVEAARILANSPDSDIEVKLCRVPVDFQKDAAAAQACYENMNPRPKTVISLGETPACDFAIETKAFNDYWDGGKNQKILPKGKESLHSELPSDGIYCSFPPEQRAHMSVSANAGNIECNDIMYKMITYFRNTDVRYGFIHVPYYDPMSNCQNRPPLQDDAQTLASLIERVVHYEPGQGPEIPEWDIPLNADGIEKLLKKIKGDDSRAQCEREILSKVGDTMDPQHIIIKDAITAPRKPASVRRR